MSSFVEKEKVKDAMSLMDAVSSLGIEVQKSGIQFRGNCPLCDTEEERSFVCTPDKNLWYSFCCEVGGDQISLWARVKTLNFKDACADMLSQQIIGSRDIETTEGLTPLDYLLHDDPAVQCVGFEPDDAKAIGIGYAKKGTMKGTVAIPVRLHDGRLVGYIGIREAVLPKSFRL